MKQPDVSPQQFEECRVAGLDLRCSASVDRALCSGAHQLGVRWKTVSCPTVLAMVWMICTPVAPVPMTATRLPAKLTGSCGQR